MVAGTSESLPVAAAGLAVRLGATLRVLTVGLRRPPMIPPEVGLDAEDEVLAEGPDRPRSRDPVRQPASAAGSAGMYERSPVTRSWMNRSLSSTAGASTNGYRSAAPMDRLTALSA